MRRLLTHCEEWWDYCSVASGLDVPSAIGTHVSAKMVEATAKSATCPTTRGVIAQVRGMSTCMYAASGTRYHTYTIQLRLDGCPSETVGKFLSETLQDVPDV